MLSLTVSRVSQIRTAAVKPASRNALTAGTLSSRREDRPNLGPRFGKFASALSFIEAGRSGSPASTVLRTKTQA